MSRRPRIAVAGVPLHIIQRGNNRQACFYDASDYRTYLDWLAQYARDSECAIHAYVLMTNHIHLLLTPSRADGPSVLMKHLGQRYAQYVNRTYQRSGTLWEGRYRSCIAQDEGYVLGCYRYIELNPVRAGMVAHPAEYPWSSYVANGLGTSRFALTPHPQYLALAGDEVGRRAAYRALFRQQLESDLIVQIRQATNGNFALGDARFRQQVARALGRRVEPRRAGRPRKPSGKEIEV
jgi:putative transposase